MTQDACQRGQQVGCKQACPDSRISCFVRARVHDLCRDETIRDHGDAFDARSDVSNHWVTEAEMTSRSVYGEYWACVCLQASAGTTFIRSNTRLWKMQTKTQTTLNHSGFFLSLFFFSFCLVKAELRGFKRAVSHDDRKAKTVNCWPFREDFNELSVVLCVIRSSFLFSPRLCFISRGKTCLNSIM